MNQAAPDGGGGGQALAMNPDELYASGTSIADLAADATSAKTKLLGAMDDAAGAVHHAKLAQALRDYRAEWAPPANQLPTDIESTGNRVSATAVDGVETDNQASTDQQAALGRAQDNSLLSRGITAQ
jgi:hypothetical protein